MRENGWLALLLSGASPSVYVISGERPSPTVLPVSTPFVATSIHIIYYHFKAPPSDGEANREATPNPTYIKAFYSSLVDAITTDPALAAIPVDDHLVHRGILINWDACVCSVCVCVCVCV